MPRALILAAALTCALALAACDPSRKDGPAAQRVEVSLQEWTIEARPGAIPSGAVLFDVTNDGGGHDHELLVLRTDLPAGALPTKPDGSVDEDAAGLEVVGASGPIEPTETDGLPLTLDPGRYVLVCNIVERLPGQPVKSHYQNGMYTSLLVRP